MAGERLIIFNTSPLVNLAEIEQLELVDLLSGRPVLPSAVQSEIRAKEPLFPKASLAVDSSRFECLAPRDALLVRSFRTSLHAGESECLALGMENPGSLLVLDDLAARSAAAASGLALIGTIGILLHGKRCGKIARLRPLINRLREDARFWLTQQLERQVLQLAGEV